MAMTKKSLDLYQRELAQRETRLDRREATLDQREEQLDRRKQRLAEREYELKREQRLLREDYEEELHRLRGDLRTAERKVTRLEEDLKKERRNRLVMARLEHELATAHRRRQELEEEIIAPRLPIRSDRTPDDNNPWRQRWRQLEQVVEEAIEKTSADRNVPDSEVLYLVALGLLLTHGKSHTIKALCTGTTIDEIADPATGAVMPPQSSYRGPLSAPSWRTSRGGGFPRWH
jgi:hypothetical protein